MYFSNCPLTFDLRASGAVHLIGNLPPVGLKSAWLARPKSDTWEVKHTGARNDSNALLLLFKDIETGIFTGLHDHYFLII